MTDHLEEARELLALASSPETTSNDDEWRCQREAGVHALVGILAELRRSNEDRALFYTTMREFFERLLEDPQPGPDGSPVGSGQPAAAPACQVCGKSGESLFCSSGPLTRTQWIAHHDDYYDDARSYNADKNGAVSYADDRTAARFGPCPEES